MFVTYPRALRPVALLASSVRPRDRWFVKPVSSILLLIRHARGPERSRKAPGASFVWKTAAQGGDVGVDVLGGILGGEARGLDLRQIQDGR